MRTALIESYIDQLRASLGKVRIPIDEDELQALYDANDYTGMVLAIQKIMKVGMQVRLELVNESECKVPARISFSRPLPMYGTSDFLRASATMNLQRNFLRTVNFEQVVCAIAHEISHLLLDALSHKLCKEEIAVDLTAMLTGFRDFYSTGCEMWMSNGSLHQQGYLSREEIRHAAHYMTFR